ARFNRYIRESAIAIVVVEDSTIEIGDEEVLPPIIVVVAHGDAESPPAMRQPGLGGHVGESSIMVVAVQLAGVALPGTDVFDRRAIDQQDVDPAVIVIVECGNAAAHRFHDVALSRPPTRKVEVEAGALRHVNEVRYEPGTGKSGVSAGTRMRRRLARRLSRGYSHSQQQ